jgi:hypothetical protein
MVDGYITQERRIEPGQIKKVKSHYSDSPFIIRNGNIIEDSYVMDLRAKQKTTSYRTNLSDESPGVKTGMELKKFLMGDYSWEFQHPGDTGHTFSTQTESVVDFSDKLLHRTWLIAGKAWALHGTIVPNTTWGSLGDENNPNYPAKLGFDINWYGNRLISSAIPTLPHANVLETTAEILREGIQLPGVAYAEWLRSRTTFFRASGGEYLNVAFGWQPLISDLIKITKSVLGSSRTILNLEKSSGIFTRRRRSLPEQRVVTTESLGNKGVVIATNGAAPGIAATYAPMFEPGGQVGAATRVKTSTQKIWFSGSFTYYLDPGTTLIGKFARYEQLANNLLGTRLTPSTLWELAPWSWLTDYFIDVQNALRTASLLQSDGSVMKYGYLMRETTQSFHDSVYVRFLGDSAPTNANITWSKTTKERYRSTPFGFGLNPNGFTDHQWAILGALGLSKGPKQLW